MKLSDSNVMLTNDPAKIIFSCVDSLLQEKFTINEHSYSDHVPYKTKTNCEMQQPIIYYALIKKKLERIQPEIDRTAF